MSALPRLFDPAEEPDFIDLETLKRDVETGRRCVECSESWETESKNAPVICTTCANTYLTNLLDQLGYTVRRDRSKTSEGHAKLARQRRDKK
jgi:DNA-directed RNA polymerase subunit RPC12/RpoP